MPSIDLTDLCGYLPAEPEEVDRFQGTLPIPSFMATPAFAAGFGASIDKFLWEACQRVYKSNLPSHRQREVGDCVSHGFSSALEYIQCVEIARGDNPDLLYSPVASEFIYGVARMDIARGKYNRGDGVDGISAAGALIQVGTVARDKIDSVDLTNYSPSRARKWGASGVPSSLHPEASKNRLPRDSITRVKHYDEAATAIRNGHPVTVCSFQGFTLHRDSTGNCAPTGYGWQKGADPRGSGHCMVFIGVREGSRPGLCCLNSWPEEMYSGPTPDDMPHTAFWVDKEIATLMLAGSADWIARRGGSVGMPISSDAWAVSLFGGFPSRLLDSSF